MNLYQQHRRRASGLIAWVLDGSLVGTAGFTNHPTVHALAEQTSSARGRKPGILSCQPQASRVSLLLDIGRCSVRRPCAGALQLGGAPGGRGLGV